MESYPPLALLGCDAPIEVSKRLSALGFNVMTLKADLRLQRPVSSHADMLIFPFKDRVFYSEGYDMEESILETLSVYGYTTVKCNRPVLDKYPHDIAFNLALIGGNIYGKTDFSAEEIISFAKENNVEIVCVNQGYTKCSTLVLGNEAIITADAGIASAATENGISVLKIENSPSAVTIKGYDYGFIGGACGVFNKKVYFTGEILTHPDGHRIVSFCNDHGFDTVSLCNGILTDIGGIIFLEKLS